MRLARSSPVLAILLLLFVCLSGMAPKPQAPPGKPDVDLEVFVRKGCPHCEAAKRFLEKLKEEQPNLKILMHDIGEDTAARIRLNSLATRLEVKHLGVPAFYARGELLIGFAGPDTTGQRIKALLGKPPPTTAPGIDLPKGACPPEATEPCGQEGKISKPQDLDVPLFGRLTLRDIGLPLFTLLIGLLDGFNPCAMWVLLFLLSLLATLRDRRKMFLLAGTFVLVSGAVYFAFMAAWLNVFLLIGYSRITQLILGSVASIIGGINIKDFFAFQRGVSLTIPESAKPGLYARIRQILQAEDFSGALAGIVVLATLVNLIELACTAGFPAMYTEILTLQKLQWWVYYGYLVLYILAYIADDALMVTLAVLTLSHRKIQEREGRWLKLISGVVMVGLGITLIGAPQWLL